MRMRTVVAVALCVLAAAWSGYARDASHVFTVGEKLGYQLHARGLYMGTQTMELEAVTQFKERDVYVLRGLSSSSRFMSMFFPVNDKWLVYIDRQNLVPLRLEKDMHEGKKKAFLVYHIDQENKRVVFENETTGSRDEKEGVHQVFDLFTVTYFYRQFPEQFDDVFTFEFLEERNIKTVQFRNEGKVMVKVITISSKKKIPAYKIKQVGGIGIEIYMSTDELRLPLKIVTPARLKKGRKLNVEMNLDKYSPGEGQADVPELYRDLLF